MDHRHLISLGVGAVFIALAFGSSGSGGDVDYTYDPVDITIDGEKVSVQEALERAADAASAKQGSTDSAAPEGECCCTFMEADAPVTRFFDTKMCTTVEGTCKSDVSECVAAKAALEKAAGSCCCAATEQIIKIGEECAGECYDFFEEGDTPGSCIY